MDALAIASPSTLGAEPLFAFGRERRMHARAYDLWVSLLHGRRMPALADLDPADTAPFAARSVLVELSAQGGRPELAFLGRELREEAGIAPARPVIGDVPQGTLLAELLRRFSDIMAYQAPVGFEAEFAGEQGGRLLYRGILLPFADAHGALAAVFGVINWKAMAETAPSPDLAAAITGALAQRAAPQPVPIWGDGPGAAVRGEALPAQSADQRLAQARTWAALAATDRTRGGASAHAAIGAAYDYYLTLRDEQPALTPGTVIDRVFGSDTPRSERARVLAVLHHAQRLGLGSGRLAAWLDGHEGGAIAVAAAERQARRAARRPREDAAAQAWAAAQPPLGHIALSPVDADFLLLIGRRAPKGVDVIAPVPADDRLTGAALKRACAG
jgi:hypothetical protein